MSDKKGKTFSNTTWKKAVDNVKDLTVIGNGDNFRLLHKISCDGRMFSAKALLTISGCIVQVSVQHQNPDGSYAVAEDVAFVPNVVYVDDVNKGRKLRSTMLADNKPGSAPKSIHQFVPAFSPLFIDPDHLKTSKVMTTGDIDSFRLMFGAYSHHEQWLKCTHAMPLGNGSLVLVYTEQINPDGSRSIDLALDYAPEAYLVEDINDGISLCI